MSQSTSPEGSPVVKTLAIRLELPLHAQLSAIAQLQGHTITDEIRQAIESHIERVRSDGTLTAKADAMRDEIERDAAARREAIASLFGDEPTTTASEQSSPPRRGRPSGRRQGS